MAEKEVTVVIDGKEHVTDATEKAGQSLTIFGKKIPLVADATQLLTGAWNLARNAIGSVSERITSALTAFDASEGARIQATKPGGRIALPFQTPSSSRNWPKRAQSRAVAYM